MQICRVEKIPPEHKGLNYFAVPVFDATPSAAFGYKQFPYKLDTLAFSKCTA